MGCEQHGKHGHKHGAGCGHVAIAHEGHTDYLHEGHLHSLHGEHVDEHRIADDRSHPSSCTPSHRCGGHDGDHQHGPGCGHEALPHGDHSDFLVAGHLHHQHGEHCDDHGPIKIV
jgi:hypothetical protein